jgi:ornithine carbamoyltransferase
MWLKGKHLMTCQEWSLEELEMVFDLSRSLKQRFYTGARAQHGSPSKSERQQMETVPTVSSFFFPECQDFSYTDQK